MGKEKNFQTKLIKEIKERFPGCIVLKNDASYIQGIPDLIVLWERFWGTLECKKDKNAIRQPNQEYYVKRMDKMSFSSFICPETKEDVLNEMSRRMKDVMERPQSRYTERISRVS